MDESDDDEVLHKESIRDYEKQMSELHRKEEINEYFFELIRWGYNIENIEDYCPKHKDTREMCKMAAYVLINNQELKEQNKKNRHLPVKRLAKVTMLKARFIEKHSRYITMIFIALNDSYSVIQEYIGGVSYGRD